jgi:hypothetical protein
MVLMTVICSTYVESEVRLQALTACDKALCNECQFLMTDGNLFDIENRHSFLLYS